MTEERLRQLLAPYVPAPGAGAFISPSSLYGQLIAYLKLLLRWNARTNLTAVRDPEEMVRRHFGESIFAAAHLGAYAPAGTTLLDLGSGAGFPGLPIQLCHPQIAVTLAESQGKKAAFLREAVRTLGISTEVWAGRAEAIPADRRFDIVTLRAVDRMDAARAAARARIRPGGFLAELTVASDGTDEGWSFPIPESKNRVLRLQR